MSPLRTTSNLQNLRKYMFCIFSALIGGSPDFLRMFQTIYTFIQWGLECVWRYTTYNFAYFYIFLVLIDGLQRFFSEILVQKRPECIQLHTTQNLTFSYIFLVLINGSLRFSQKIFAISYIRDRSAFGGIPQIILHNFLFLGVDWWFTKTFLKDFKQLVHQGPECIWRYTT